MPGLGAAVALLHSRQCAAVALPAAAAAQAPRFRETGAIRPGTPLHTHPLCRLGSPCFSPAGTSRIILPRRMSAADGRRQLAPNGWAGFDPEREPPMDSGAEQSGLRPWELLSYDPVSERQ